MEKQLETIEVLRDELRDHYLNRDLSGVLGVEYKLRMKRMDEDKEFRDFLMNQHDYDMSYENPYTPLWKQYKEKLTQYQETSKLINLCHFYKSVINVQ